LKLPKEVRVLANWLTLGRRQIGQRITLVGGLNVAREENDTWDLTTGVGAIATAAAAARALASRGASPLIKDVFAEPLVRALGVDFFTRLASGELDPAEIFGMHMAYTVAVRTRFFDEFLSEATKTGIRQAVILAAGLDSRPYRLSWPAGMAVYEIDQPQVIDFKTKTLADIVQTADRRAVGIDLRQDWPAALRRAGFDAAQPTAWGAEAMLDFLPSDAQDRLLDNVTALSAAGSRLATDYLPNRGHVDTMMTAQAQPVTDRWRDHGLDIDIADLIYPGDRNDVVHYLATHGWGTVETSLAELFVASGLAPLRDDEVPAPFTSFVYVTATRK
jgi:methyltransferase (TIGR00027 family)